MSPIEEALRLLEKQPEENIRIIVELLRAMDVSAAHGSSVSGVRETNPARTQRSFGSVFGAGRKEISLPEGFFEHFDDANEEIAEQRKRE